MITKLISHAKAYAQTFRRDESGATMVEYGVALLIVFTIGLVVVTTLGGEVNSIFNSVITAFTGTTAGAVN